MGLSPIVLFTFNRLDHTKKTVEALKNNILAEDSELIIFLDGARNENETNIIENVREYLDTITGFKNIDIRESKVNNGLAKSVINGVTSIINEYGKVIVLEDDLVTSKYFLTYMNECLDKFENRQDIWSIGGYCPKIDIPVDYNDDIYITKRGCSWGWATWKDRWKKNDWEIKDYSTFKNDRKKRKEFNESGKDMSYMLDDQMAGRINSWAIRWCYNQFKLDKFTVYPVKSLVKNIGNDLSGTHTAMTDIFNVDINNNKVCVNKNINENLSIIHEFKKFYDNNFSGYGALFFKKVGLYKYARKYRNRIIRLVRG